MNTIFGSKYRFEIVSYETVTDCFFIRAKCKFTGRFSCINNLNPILSKFNIDMNDAKAEDSMWRVTKSEAQNYVAIAKEFLSDTSFLTYLEDQLDEDRRLGEWENIS